MRITELFIREQQRHAALLREFMGHHGIDRKETDLTDFVFCCLRRVGGYEIRLNVLIAAELDCQRLLPGTGSRYRLPAPESVVPNVGRRRVGTHRTGVATVAACAHSDRARTRA